MCETRTRNQTGIVALVDPIDARVEHLVDEDKGGDEVSVVRYMFCRAPVCNREDFPIMPAALPGSSRRTTSLQ